MNNNTINLITLNELKIIISKMGNTSPGPHNIHVILLENSTNELIDFLVLFFNFLMKNGMFIVDFKIGNLYPLVK